MYLEEKAAAYAKGKVVECLSKTIADAYAAGYKAGYNDKEVAAKVVPNDNEVEYVDLGLPSGTLWASNWLEKDGETIFLTHQEAQKKNIPTKEQWDELLEHCKSQYDYDFANQKYGFKSVEFVGVTGKSIRFKTKGYWVGHELHCIEFAFFWLEGFENNEEHTELCGGVFRGNQGTIVKSTDHLFAGAKCPVWLVK